MQYAIPHVLFTLRMAALGKEGVQKHVYVMMVFKPHLLAHTRFKKMSKVPRHH